MTFLMGLGIVVSAVCIVALIVSLVAHEVEMLMAARRDQRRRAHGKRLPMARRVRKW